MKRNGKKRTQREPSYYDWDANQVAAYFGVHVTSVYNWTRYPNPLPHGRIGRSYRFSSEEVKRWHKELVS